MKTETKIMDKCQVQLTVTLDADEAKACIKEVEKAFVREARLPGFRPGKAPIELIRKNFSADIQKETVGAMLRKHYSDAVKAEGLEEVALADVHDVSCTAEGGAFTAVVEVKEGYHCTEYELNEFCQDLPKYKRPRKYIFAPVPRNATGKIEKPHLRELYGGANIVAEENEA